MKSERVIQIIYAPGTFGNCLRWMFDRFTPGSKFKDVDSPWDSDDRAHGFEDTDFNIKFTKAHQLISRNGLPDPTADKVVIYFDTKDLLFIERCGFYRNPGSENEETRYQTIIQSANTSFVTKTFGDIKFSKSVAKELVKIQFHDIRNHAWWNAMNDFLENNHHHHFDMYSLWDQTLLKNELMKVSKRYKLDFEIDDKVINNVVEKIQKSYPVVTRHRAHKVLDAIDSKHHMDCAELDILEQAYIEVELEKIHDCVIFPYGTNWFADTDSIREFLDTYPTYLKHMNPRLPWYNNMKNPFYLTGKIDKSK